MATIPQIFPEQPEQAIASYDYVDIAEGIGVSIFYLATARDSSGMSYLLSDNTWFSSDGDTTRTEAGTTTMNFDLTAFNLPRSIKGTARAVIGMVSAGTGSSYLLLQVQKWDGATPTNVSSEIQSQTISSAIKKICINIPLTQTHFKKGEVLRFVVKLVTSGTHTPAMAVGHHPQNEDGAFMIEATYPGRFTASRFYCPFKIDL